MRKIDLILENIRDEYMINLLEEGEVTELETLKTKKFLNESLGRIRGLLVEEGTMDAVKNNLKNNWGKYLAGAGAAGLATAAATHPEFVSNLVDKVQGQADSMNWDNTPKDINGIGIGQALDDTKPVMDTAGAAISPEQQEALAARTQAEQDAILNPQGGVAQPNIAVQNAQIEQLNKSLENGMIGRKAYDLAMSRM